MRKSAQGRRLRTLTTTLVLALLAALFLAGSAQAAKPGRPTAKTPNATSTVITATPTFKWGKAARATRYEVRVYKGGALQVKKTGIRRLSWKSSKVLTKGDTYTWKVRGRKAGVNGRWSRSLKFTVASSAKTITAFSFQGLAPPVTGTITEADHTIALTVPFSTDLSALVATFTTSGASVAVGATPQVSSTTANDFSSPVTYTVTAADTTTQAYTVTVTVAADPAKAITAFSFSSPAATGTITEASHTIALTVPFGTDLTGLVATFTTDGAAVAVGAVSQVSGTTVNDFSSPVTYTVTAADASTQTYTVTVTVAANPAKAITAFSFQGLDPPVTGVISEKDYTIALTVPFKTDVSALVASFTTTGASVAIGDSPQVSGTTANDFSGPVTYTVTAADASTQDYVVTVTVAAEWEKAVTAFSFQELTPAVTGVISEADHTIALTVPAQTDPRTLIATFATTGVAVAVSSTPQASGKTENDFTKPLVYTVTAGDGSTQDYEVTVTVVQLAIGDAYQGGKVAYILQPADPGYSAAVQHGLIAATADQASYPPGMQWSTEPYWWNSAPGTSTALGSGSANTDAIIALNGAGTTYAAGLARAYNGGGHSDWYLPSKDELDKLYLNRVAIGGFDTAAYPYPWYWSSSVLAGDAFGAWGQYFDSGNQYVVNKDYKGRVRAVRSF